MAFGSHARELFHWEKTVPLTPSNVLYGLAGLVIVATYLRMRMLRNAAKARETVSKSRDKAWNREKLRQGTADMFREIQAAWNQGNAAKLERRLERKLFEEWSERLASLKLKGERRSMAHITVHKVEILNAKDYLDNTRDEFTARISFDGLETVGEAEGEDRAEEGRLVEYWKMGRSGEAWKVREVMRDGVLARISLALEPPDPA
ncbi:MAG TPA: TIM44-like domain-containing protein [Fibrobacteria bacterium]|nr:TIM44-like domain-containing protein [Fibrobacteria bacterium]